QQYDEAATLLTSTIQTARDLATPTLKITPHTKRWWTPELDDLRTTQQHHLRQFQRTREDTDRPAYKVHRSNFLHALRKRKAEHWTDYLESLEGSRIYEALSSKARQRRIPPL
ncbi:hypothetical protein BJ508DRAFT_189889, partial [Ascobolus immersus RN42]